MLLSSDCNPHISKSTEPTTTITTPRTPVHAGIGAGVVADVDADEISGMSCTVEAILSRTLLMPAFQYDFL